MNKMRYYKFSLISLLILTSSLFLPTYLHAELKVIERSADKIPDWMMQHTQDHLVCMAQGNSLSEARQLLEQELLRQVASAIAVHIEGATIADSGIEAGQEWDTFHSNLATSIARLPFITDITLAKCKDIYWDHVIDKNSGKECYRITALYPFDSNIREKLINQYETYDSDLEKTLVEIEERWKIINSSGDAAQAVATLEALSESFLDSNRRNRCKSTLELYGKIGNSLSLEATILSEGVCQVRVMRGNTVFHTEGRIDVVSGCASNIKVAKDEVGWTIRYSNEDCLDDEPNSLKITLRDKGLRLKTEVNF